MPDKFKLPRSLSKKDVIKQFKDLNSILKIDQILGKEKLQNLDQQQARHRTMKYKNEFLGKTTVITCSCSRANFSTQA